ncbi:acyl-CoA dehydrogenase family protein [Chelatococcus reniformis]|uniref:Acyl-CoA dehydrogenase n=1 Tax=Chelatococcus reniformis TaxID=1494448 RepID=A0A916UBE4_9HYPH|nr:acyl-CoA dehydrogenase family protein [Chelatococcus reniformis]GGC66131.1 acyl-CoA dehydrogenase [Chelatococcus reniformis]
MATLAREERLAFQDQVRRLLADRSTEAEVRRTMELPAGYDPSLWRQLAELGVVGLLIDEAHGGTGAGPMELELVMEEVGAALLCGPLLSSGVLAAGLLQALGDADAQARLLPRIADGSAIATVAITGTSGTWTPEGVAVTATAAGDGWRLDGEASYVTHGQNADVFLVAANAPDGLAVFEVATGAAGLATTALPTFDHTLRLAQIRFAGVPARRLAARGGAWDAVEQALDLARVALAGEQAGAGRRVLEFTVDYAKTRVQFGRAIGSFQAIKHMAADLLLEAESAISAARHAAQALAEGAPDRDASISLAAFACADAFSTITATAVQMHGGIAFTWAHPAHLYLRRARADAQLFGTPAFYRDRYVQQLGG